MTEGEIRLNIRMNLEKYMGTGKKIKISVVQLAKKSGIPYSTVRHTKYHGLCGLYSLSKIADALNVTVDDLIKYRR